jgi:hypothetical protein
VPLDSQAATLNNLGLGTPFAGNLMVYPLYRIDQPSGVETAEKRGQRLEVYLKMTPNPFVSFSKIPGHSSDRFSLYDISGRRVGVYRGDRIGEGLRAGVYFVRAESQDAKPVRIVKIR